MDNKDIVSSIKRMCKKNNITIRQLEKEIGLSQGLVSKWMYTTPSLDKIVDIAKFFKVTIDEVVNYNSGINDEFLSVLTHRTEIGVIKWHSNDRVPHDNVSNIIKDSFSEEIGLDEVEVTYYTEFRGGFILLYSRYQYQNALNPYDLELYIKPNINSNPVVQNYEKNGLISLYLRVLYNLHEEAPDEIAAEEFKHSFILNTSDDSDDYLDHSILDQLERMPGCIIYTFGSQTMTSSSTRLDFKGIQDYYYNNKRKLGHVRTAMMYKGNMLLLISSEKVMKIEGLTCGKEATEDSIQVIQSILSNSGFIVPQGYLYDHESFVKTR